MSQLHLLGSRAPLRVDLWPSLRAQVRAKSTEMAVRTPGNSSAGDSRERSQRCMAPRVSARCNEDSV